MKIHTFIYFILVSLIIWLISGLIFITTTAFCQNPYGTIRIHVKGFFTETPLQGAKISLSPNNYSSIINESGVAFIEGIMPFRNYQIKVMLKGYIPQGVGFVSINANEQTEIFVPMKQKAGITGTVKIYENFLSFLDNPLEDVIVIIGNLKKDLNVFQVIKSAYTDKKGVFSFNCVKEGKYKIVALKAEYKKSEMYDITVKAGKIVSQDFLLKRKRRNLIGNISPEIIITEGLTDEPREKPYPSSTKFYFTAYPKNTFQEFYWIKENQPKEAVRDGNDLYYGQPKGNVFCYVLSAIGEYKITLVTIDEKGIAAKASITFEASNMAPEAIASVIPGPSELPLIDNNLVYTISSGSSSVIAGSSAYLRGFGIDINLLSPDKFNPNDPSFDFY